MSHLLDPITADPATSDPRPGPDAPPRPKSLRRQAASRANGRKSRGPSTSEGKASSSKNAIKHGLLAGVIVLEQEDPAVFESFAAELHDYLRPANPIARMLVDDLVAAHWRRTRVRRIESETYNIGIEVQIPNSIGVQHAAALAFRQLTDATTTLQVLNRYERGFERQIVRTLRLLPIWNEPDNSNFQTTLVPNPNTPDVGRAPQPAPDPPIRPQTPDASGAAAALFFKNEAAPLPPNPEPRIPTPVPAPTLVGCPHPHPLLSSPLAQPMPGPSLRRRARHAAAAFFLAASLALAAHAPVAIDASKPAPAPQSLPFAAGGRAPDGRTLSINSRYLSLDGKPWFPVMGEFHYSRSAPETWERELLKMKAGGVTVVSTYVFWIHHEEIEGQFDWSGRRDLRRFVELAGRAGLSVWVRAGPWAHGEVRNGGLPDWVLTKSKSRTNDPAYLNYVRRYYSEIGRQIHGLFFKDGGPIAGVQIENEYHPDDPGEGKAHILKLLQLAKDAGLDAPFYTVTAWDAAAVPARSVIPIFGGYPDGFWYRTNEPLPPSPDYFFTAIRRDETVDDHLRSKRPDTDSRYAAYPYLTAEMAGGMAEAYHRRPVMTADDIAALDVAKLGSGVSLYGYYMFHGGTNPDGKLTSLQESQATGYWNDLPLKGYDYQAPIGEFGQLHPSFRVLKSIHLFLHDYGSGLAPLAPYFADRQPASRLDVETPRVAVRSDSTRGYIFVNNYQKDRPLPDRRDFQVAVKLAQGAVTVPRQPITVPSGAYFFWPIETEIGSATLEYASAQPLCHLDDPDTAVFFTWAGIAAEFAFHDSPGLSIEAPGAKVVRDNGRVYVTGISAGLTPAIRIVQGDRVTQILVVTREQAGNLWKARLAGRDRLIYSTADLWFEPEKIHLQSRDPLSLDFAIFPALAQAPSGFTRAGSEGIFHCYRTQVAPIALQAEVKQTKQPGIVPPSHIGTQKVVALPDESIFHEDAARWSIHVPGIDSPAVDDALLSISYTGDIARISAAGHLLTDEFYRGAPWEIGLPSLAGSDLELAILPLRADSPVYIGGGFKPAIPTGKQAAAVTSVTVIPLYHAVAEVHP